MTTEQQHSCKNDEQTLSNIEKFGLTVILIEATDYLPSFAYSIGLWKNYNHPEIISFGLTVKTLHGLINAVAEMVKSGNTFTTGKAYDDFVENFRSEFLLVDPKNIPDYFGYAIDFYKTKDFPALQLIWTDRNDRFPWDKNFEEEFKLKQPLLDRNTEFKFSEAENVAVFTTRQWIELDKPILRVVHESDGDWQFLTGDQMPDDIKIVALKEVISRDLTLNDVFNLDYGEQAEREFIGGQWKRDKVSEE